MGSPGVLLWSYLSVVGAFSPLHIPHSWSYSWQGSMRLGGLERTGASHKPLLCHTDLPSNGWSIRKTNIRTRVSTDFQRSNVTQECDHVVCCIESFPGTRLSRRFRFNTCSTLQNLGSIKSMSQQLSTALAMLASAKSRSSKINILLFSFESPPAEQPLVVTAPSESCEGSRLHRSSSIPHVLTTMPWALQRPKTCLPRANTLG